jgi:hypothetical protein
MTQLPTSPSRTPARLAVVALLASLALPAAAQIDTQRPKDLELSSRQRVTSSLDATAPSPAEQREARALAAALFARPAAAARAADKAAPVTQADAVTVEPKSDWESKDGLQFGGKGLQFKSPF